MKLIKINKNSYPAYPTMGSMARYKDLTGKELGSEEAMSSTDSLTYMYCCCRSACNREGVDFPFADFQDFADAVMPADFKAWAEELAKAQQKEAEAEAEKKA